MIGIVIVAHDALAHALAATTEHVVGAQTGLATVAIGPNDDLRARQAEIEAAVDAVDSGSGVILVTDMFGGTPSNLAHGAMKSADVEVIYGANMPMLVKLAKMRDRPLAEAVQAALKSGRRYISSAGVMLNPDKPPG